MYSQLAGVEEMCFMFGLDFGATFLGVLFHVMGTRYTLMTYAGMTAVMLIVLLSYIKYSKQVKEYEKLPVDKFNESGDDCNDDDKDGDDDDFNDGNDYKHEITGNM